MRLYQVVLSNPLRLRYSQHNTYFSFIWAGIKLQRFFEDILIFGTNFFRTLDLYNTCMICRFVAKSLSFFHNHLYLFHHNSFKKSKYLWKIASLNFKPMLSLRDRNNQFMLRMSDYSKLVGRQLPFVCNRVVVFLNSDKWQMERIVVRNEEKLRPPDIDPLLLRFALHSKLFRGLWWNIKRW